MGKTFRLILAFVVLLVIQPAAAEAYIGPGVATGAIVAVFGVIGSFFLAIFAVIWYPVKRLLKRRKVSDPADSKSQTK